MTENGWVKIHGNHILYDGYLQADYGKPLIHITEKQKGAIVEYGINCCNDLLKLGLKFNQVSTSRFKSIEKHMLHKQFSF